MRFQLYGPTENPPKIEIKQSKRPKKSKNQIHFHPTFPSHSKMESNNQNPGIIPVNVEHWPSLHYPLAQFLRFNSFISEQVWSRHTSHTEIRVCLMHLYITSHVVHVRTCSGVRAVSPPLSVPSPAQRSRLTPHAHGARRER